MDIAKSIDAISKSQTPLQQNIDQQGPGGQSYDLAPTPVREINAGTPPGTFAKIGKRTTTLALKYPLWTGLVGIVAGLAAGAGLGRLSRRSASR